MDKISRLYAKTPIVKKSNSPLQIQRKKPSQPLKTPADRILFLQRTIGNQAVRRLIKTGTLQPKLRIGQPGDKYEQEADRVADEMMRMSELKKGPADSIHIQRACLGCEEEKLRQQPIKEEEEELQRQVKEEDDEILQTKENPGLTPGVISNLRARIRSLGGGGQLLPRANREFVERKFGIDFNDVRLHTDSDAAQMCREIQSRYIIRKKTPGS